MYIEIIFSLLIGYLLGAIPFALVIGKVFYKTDVRQYGSKNLGGGNTGRVLGKKAGVAVMTLDILKVTLAVFIASRFEHCEITMALTGLAAAVGHCFPVFAGFKGGKAVAAMYGFLFGLALFSAHNLLLFLLPLIVFLVVLYLFKIIAAASICAAVFSTVYVYVVTGSFVTLAAFIMITLLLTYRHKANILRIINHCENKISWM